MRNYTEINGKIRSCKIRYCKGEDSLVYGVQQEKSQNGKRKGILHGNMLLPYEAILEDSEGFHLKKELQMKIKQEAACHESVTQKAVTPVTQKAVRMISKG